MNINKKVIVCKRCILDSTIPQIEFDEDGMCYYCKLHDELDKEFPIHEQDNKMLNDLVESIKKFGKGKEYDCIVGVSGGTDSSYALYMAKKLGLRPLAVHFDNGWNSEIAVNNIKNITKILDVDLYTYVVDWEEFKDLQVSILKASIPDTELPTDLGIHSILYKVSNKFNVKYILNGISFRTEGNTPSGWDYGDGRLLKYVHSLYGKRKIKTYPILTLSKIFYYIFVKGIKVIRFLNYFDYDKAHTREFLEKELGWKYYGGHHYESIFTRFYQSYIAPVKYGIDYRYITLSAAVRSGHITKEKALETINSSDYSEELFLNDKEYIAKKLGLSLDEFERILCLPNKTHLNYKSYYGLMNKLKYILKPASKLKIIPIIYHKNKYSD